jgi:Cof subfamily protein (haloacid dehalogenase superfamily)
LEFTVSRYTQFGSRMPTLKGVVFDIDGTLLTSANVVSTRLRNVSRSLAANGIWLSLASARPAASVQRIAGDIGASGPFCALNGALVVTASGSVISRTPLPRDLADMLTTRFRADPLVSLNLYAGADWLVARLDDRIEHEANTVEFAPTINQDLAGIGDIEKILLMAGHDDAAAIAASLSGIDDRINVARSNPGYVEITAAKADKRTGVEAAAGVVGLSLRDLVACGDGENDISLLSRAGYGIAMAHAPPALRAVAAEVVGSNDDDSLAAALMTVFALHQPSQDRCEPSA